MKSSLEKGGKFVPIFGRYDDDKVAKYGRWGHKDELMRYYFNFEDACAAAGIEVSFSQRGYISIEGMSNSRGARLMAAWKDFYFDALWGYLHRGCHADDDIAEAAEKTLLAELDEDERQERTSELLRRREEFMASKRPQWEERSMKRGDGAYFEKYDERMIRYIGNLWTGKGIRFYIDLPAACDLIGWNMVDCGYWHSKTYFDAHQGRFVFDRHYGDGRLEKELKQACKCGKKTVMIPEIRQEEQVTQILAPAM